MSDKSAKQMAEYCFDRSNEFFRSGFTFLGRGIYYRYRQFEQWLVSSNEAPAFALLVLLVGFALIAGLGV